MFGEDESESPRVPSPWDSLMSSPASSSPYSRPVSSPPLATSNIPQLVPENDDGNVEYKLQLLNPSAARFARLVTQMKWRLLEGGGQAYYELGVADSGALVGLSRNDLERSLETLEMMAGEIGASVIVVKEIEVPAAMAELAAAQEDYRNRKERRGRGSDDGTTTTSFDTETELSTTEFDGDGDEDGLVYGSHKFNTFKDSSVSSVANAVFVMDPEPDPGNNADVELDGPQFSIDLEISSVFKPRPMRRRMQSHILPPDSKRNHKGPKPKKLKHQASSNASDGQKPQLQFGKAHSRRQARDRRREEKQKALLAIASNSLTADASAKDAESLVSGLESLHVTMDQPEPIAVAVTDDLASDDAIPAISLTTDLESELKVHDLTDIDEVDDIFSPPTSSMPYTTFPPSSHNPVTPLSEGTDGMLAASTACNEKGEKGKDARLIVEALVVRKMSLEEAFLDFSGFAT